jgi:CheY-like chemotaxis protein
MSEAENPPPPDLRRLLIDAALRILEEPDTPLDLRKVAEAAGKSRTAPYLAFGKESEGGGLVGLRLAVAAEGMTQLAAAMEAAEEAAPNPLVAFRDVAEAFFEFAVANPRLFRLMYGPEIGVGTALRQSEERTLHPELTRLMDVRIDVERIVWGILGRCPKVGVLESANTPENANTLEITKFAMASLVGIAILLLDDVLDLAGVHTTPASAAALATEVLLDREPERLTQAALTLLGAIDAKAPIVVREDRAELSWAENAAFRALRNRSVLHDASPEADAPLMPNASPMRGPSLMRDPSPMRSPSPMADTDPATSTISRSSALRRAALARSALRSARILWVDDHPESVSAERRTLELLDASITQAASTDDALTLLARGHYDLILSDIERSGKTNEGVRALPWFRRLASNTPVVFYVGAVDPALGVPAGSAGITSEPEELLHLILDVLERRRV